MKLEHVVEADKRHPRDPFNYGRVRVRLFGADDQPLVADVGSKKALLKKLGELIPQLKARVQGPVEKKPSGGDKAKKGKKQPPTTGGGKKKK